MKEIGKIISFQNTHQSEGFHTKVEDFKDVPFDIKRTYWTYDIPAGAARGGHAHKECLEVIIAASGSFTVTLNDGKTGRLSSEPPRPRTAGKHGHLAHPPRFFIGVGLLCLGFRAIRCRGLHL